MMDTIIAGNIASLAEYRICGVDSDRSIEGPPGSGNPARPADSSSVKYSAPLARALA